ncbi:unnamed protein product [Brassica rapa]|uniref:Uncharacterized protein n=1 Tax=Brassica campestris TaxID=3711 RepID=A0A3P5ZFC9_BRACM|nr:unnamed protein product [Brassica rapa]VDC76999.1 unnamed protein product [Brassica rapa]
MQSCCDPRNPWVEKDCVCIITSSSEGGDIHLFGNELILNLTLGLYLLLCRNYICRWMVQLLLAIDYLHNN